MSQTPSVSFRWFVRRRPTWVSAIEAIVAVIAALVLSAQLIPILGSLLFGVLVPVSGLLALLASLSRMRRAEGEGTLFLEENGLRVRTSESPIDRHYASSSFLFGVDSPARPQWRGATLTLHMPRGATLVFETDEGERVLDHLGLAAKQRAATFALQRTLGAFTIGFLSFFAWLVPMTMLTNAVWGPHGIGLAILASIVASILTGYRFGRPRLLVGTDGVLIHGTLLRKFVPYADIDRVSARPFRIVRKDGRNIHLPMVAADNDVEAVIRRIEQARSDAGTAAAVASLARGSQTMEEWRETIQRIVFEPAGYRAAPIDPDALERAVSDASAPLDVRLGAAMALRVADDTAAPRIRIVADSSLSDDTRAALTAASEEDVDLDAIDRVTRAR